MRSAKKLCKEHNLSSYQAQKGAELALRVMAEDIWKILNTFSTIPLHERVAEYLKND